MDGWKEEEEHCLKQSARAPTKPNPPGGGGSDSDGADDTPGPRAPPGSLALRTVRVRSPMASPLSPATARSVTMGSV
jgi:hypothetical protein